LTPGGSNLVVSMIVEPAGTLAVFGQQDAHPWSRLATLGGNFPPGAPITVDVQNGTQIAAFVVGNDGQLHGYTTSKTGDGTSWTSLALPTTAILPPGAPLATVHRGGGELDVLLVDDGGDLHMYSAVGAGAWSDAKVLGGSSPKFPFRAGVAAALQPIGGGSFQPDVFVADTAGSVWAYFSSNAQGAGWLRTSLGGVGVFPPGAGLAAATQSPDQLDLFAIDGGGSVEVFWAVDGGAWSRAPIPHSGLAPGVPGAPITAIDQGPNQADVAFVGQNGWTQLYWSVGAITWAGANLPMNAMPGSPVRAVAQSLNADGTPSQIDVFTAVARGVYMAGLRSGTWAAAQRAL
jgi:hypothetical protein